MIWTEKQIAQMQRDMYWLNCSLDCTKAARPFLLKLLDKLIRVEYVGITG